MCLTWLDECGLVSLLKESKCSLYCYHFHYGMLNTIFKVVFSVLCFVVLLCATLRLHHFLIEAIDSHIKETLPLRIKLFYGFLVMALFAVILFAFWRMLEYIQTSVLSTILRGIFIVQFVWLSISLGLFLYTSTTNTFYLNWPRWHCLGGNFATDSFAFGINWPSRKKQVKVDKQNRKNYRNFSGSHCRHVCIYVSLRVYW